MFLTPLKTMCSAKLKDTSGIIRLKLRFLKQGQSFFPDLETAGSKKFG